MNVQAPQYGITVMPKAGAVTARGLPVMMLVLSVDTGASMHTFYLCDAQDNYQDIAKQIHDKINEAGRQARRAESGLIEATGVNSNGFRAKE